MVWLYSTKPLSALTLICHHQNPPHHFYTILITFLDTYHYPTTIVTNIPPHTSLQPSPPLTPPSKPSYTTHNIMDISTHTPSPTPQPTATLTSEHHTTQTNIPSQTSTPSTTQPFRQPLKINQNHHLLYHQTTFPQLLSRLLSFSACFC